MRYLLQPKNPKNPELRVLQVVDAASVKAFTSRNFWLICQAATQFASASAAGLHPLPPSEREGGSKASRQPVRVQK